MSENCVTTDSTALHRRQLATGIGRHLELDRGRKKGGTSSQSFVTNALAV